jgi:hypothetical protein
VVIVTFCTTLVINTEQDPNNVVWNKSNSIRITICLIILDYNMTDKRVQRHYMRTPWYNRVTMQSRCMKHTPKLTITTILKVTPRSTILLIVVLLQS